MKKISNKIAVAIVTLTFAISLTLGIFLYVEAKALIRKEAEQNLMTTLDREAKIVDSEFTRVKRLSLVIKSTVESTLDLEQAVSNPNYMVTYKQGLTEIFKRLLADFDNVSDWVLFNSKVIPGTNTVSFTFENGQYIREPEYDVIDDGYASETWWQEAIVKGEYWTTPYYWEPWNANVISYSIPLTSKGKLIGVAGAELFLSAFQERLKDIKIYESGYVMLVTDTGEEIYLPDDIDLQRFRTWYSENKAYIKEHPIGLQYLPLETGEEIVAWHMLSNGWLLLAHPKTEEMFGGLAILNFITIIIILLSIPLSLGMGVFVSKTLTKRLSDLTYAAEAMLDHQDAITLPISSNDEIGTLTKAFNQMQQDVKATLTELKFNEAKYRSLVENSSNMIYTIDVSGAMTTTNQMIEEMAGMSKSELVGHHFTELFKTQETALYFDKAFDELLSTQNRVERICQLKNPQGQFRTITTTLIPIFDEVGNLISVMGNSSDITDRIETEKEIARLLSEENDQLNQIISKKTIELESAMKEIMEIDKIAALGRLVSGIAHEINTPLGNAISLNSLLEKNFESCSHKLSDNSLSRTTLESLIEQSNEAISGISRNLNKTATLVNNFKFLNTSGSSETKIPVEIHRLINFTFSSLISSISHGSLTLDLHCREDLVIESYPGAITQVLTNLIFNAVDHGLADTSEPKITIDVIEQSETILLLFSDNGIGMDEETQKHIFEPFFTTKRSNGNTGLGLSIVFAKTTGILNSRITCESQLGKGTTFAITMPKI